MTKVAKISKATDADAEYVLHNIAEADACDLEAAKAKDFIEQRGEAAQAYRLNAGARLIKVREQRSKKSNARDTDLSRALGWREWLQKNGIAETTARDHMKLAGWTPEERTERRQKDTERKRTERVRLKVVRNEPPKRDRKLIIEDDCDDCNTEQERWQRSFSVLAGDAVSMAAYWKKEFGAWDQFPVTTDMVALAEQAAASWQQMVVQLKQRKIK